MTKRQRIGALGLAAVVAVVAVVVLGLRDEAPETADRQSAVERADSAPPGGTPARPSAAAPEYTTVRVGDGEPAGGPERISLEQGEMARIEFRSERDTEIHIHGYDRYVDVEAGEPERTSFRANLEGVFEIEDHDTATQVAELRVNP